MSLKPESTLKHFGFAFLLALIIYICFFSCDSHLRHRKGAWQVEFSSQAGEPVVTINEPVLGIRDVRLIFAGEKAANEANGTVVFDKPGKTLPFGRIKFEDLTYLPGAEVFELFGHEVQLMPRTLTINHREMAWTNGSALQLRSEEKLPPAPEKPFRSRSRGAFEKAPQ